MRYPTIKILPVILLTIFTFNSCFDVNRDVDRFSLNPINEEEILDGQQRITTIILILRYYCIILDSDKKTLLSVKGFGDKTIDKITQLIMVQINESSSNTENKIKCQN